MAEEGSSSLRRAIAILNALATARPADGGGPGVVKIAHKIGREKSQVSRTLKVLAEAGFVERDSETLGYRLGWRMCTLGSVAADQRLLALAPPVLRRLSEIVGERAHLSVRVGTSVLTVLSEGSPRAIEASEWIGRATSVHNTSAGRALLFDNSDDDVRALLAETRFNADAPNAPRDVDELLERLRAARRRGAAVIDEEFEANHVAAAAPVCGLRGQTIAAINVSAPKFRLGPHLDAVGCRVMAAANQVSKQLTSEPVSQSPGPARAERH
jgi:DNA-binding IclR family transcriptional regulator